MRRPCSGSFFGNMRRYLIWPHVIIVLGLFLVLGCGAPQTPAAGHGPAQVDVLPALSAVALAPGERLRVVATTSIVGDVVQNVGGEHIDLTVLLPPGTDPHTFDPTPRDVAAVADAHVVFVNGAGLEVFLEKLLQGAGGARVVPVSYGVELRRFEHGHEEEAGDEHAGEYDPHTWFDPNNVIVWVRNVEWALNTLDPANVAGYQGNAAAYEAELQVLDAWIREQVAQVPPANRCLVTDHESFSYFTQRYGFEQVGAVFPGYSTLAQPSAMDLADLEAAIRTQGVRAVFVGKTVNPALAEQVAQDTGVQLVFLYTGSLGEPGDPADTYLAMMHYDVSAIVEALR